MIVKKCNKCKSELTIDMIYALTQNTCPYCGEQIFIEGLVGILIGKILQRKLLTSPDNDRQLKAKLVNLIISASEEVIKPIAAEEEAIIKTEEGEEEIVDEEPLDEEEKAILEASKKSVMLNKKPPIRITRRDS